MRRLLKFSVIVFAFIIIISTFLVFPASAASIKYSASSASGTQGSTVTINVNLSGGVELWGSSVRLGYDSSKLQYVSSNTGSVVASGSLNNTGSSVNFAGNLDKAKAKNGGTVFSVTFKILMSSGSSTLTVSSTGGKDNCDYNGDEVAYTTSNGTVTVTKPVTGITLDKSSVTLKKGETSQLTATVTPSDATDKTVTYSSSNTKVATVSGSGKITAVGAGSATITAKAGSKTATCNVSVKVTQTGIAASGGTSRSVEEGGSLKLSVTKVPSDATDDYSVTWVSANTNIATVSSNGTVTGVAVGSTTVTAKSNNWTVTFNVTVTEKVTETETESATEPVETTEEEIFPPTTEPETVSETEAETEPSQESLSDYFAGIIERLTDEDNKVTRLYHYLMLLAVAVITAAIAIPVTFIATSGYYKNKTKNDENFNDLDER
ncbi:MAG: Ig-like domain-containing protein [Oscillospiraceae bacterium]|nr:Ig-like domain-containing protein [Oscillospiraceae bacterium]